MLAFIGIPEGEEKEKGTESIFNATTEGNSVEGNRPPILRRTEHTKYVTPKQGFPSGVVNNRIANVEMQVCPGSGRSLIEMNPFSTLAKTILWTEEPGRPCPQVCQELYTTECVHRHKTHTHRAILRHLSNAVKSNHDK